MLNETTLYTVRRTSDRFCVVKFDFLFNVERVLNVTRNRRRILYCDCERHNEFKCKHRRLVLMFEEHRKVNKGWFYNWDDHSWEPPLTWPISRSQNLIRVRKY